MEAFEYKNFTSKSVVLHRINKRGNVPSQSLKVLQLMYKTSYHNVAEEQKVRRNNKRKRDISKNNIKTEYVLPEDNNDRPTLL